MVQYSHITVYLVHKEAHTHKIIKIGSYKHLQKEVSEILTICRQQCLAIITLLAKHYIDAQKLQYTTGKLMPYWLNSQNNYAIDQYRSNKLRSAWLIVVLSIL